MSSFGNNNEFMTQHQNYEDSYISSKFNSSNYARQRSDSVDEAEEWTYAHNDDESVTSGHGNANNSYMSDEKVEKSRERNREHAKKTRLRKKAMLENLKARLLELQNEATRLQQAFEESNTANILLCLGTKNDSAPTRNSEVSSETSVADDASSVSPSGFIAVSEPYNKGNIIDQLRSIVRAEAAIYLKPKFEQSFGNGSVSHGDMDGSFSDNEEDDGRVLDPAAASRGVTSFKNGQMISAPKGLGDDVDAARRERNRMHAKLTRDRKKMFTSRLQQLIHALERQNMSMKNRLQQNLKNGSDRPSLSTTASQSTMLLGHAPIQLMSTSSTLPPVTILPSPLTKNLNTFPCFAGLKRKAEV